MAHILNEDIFHHILQACSQPTLATLSRISSQFRLLAMPHLFRNVSLNCNPEQTIIFLDFIINNTQRKNSDEADTDPHSEITGMGRYVLTFEILAFDTFIEIREDDRRRLVLEKPEPYPISAWASSLTRALALMPNLHSFVIHDHIEDIAFHSPDFPLTLLSRPRLTKIELQKVGPVALKSFGPAMNLRKHATKLRSVKFKLIYISHHGRQLQWIIRDGLESVLFYSRKYLEEVSLDSCILHELLMHRDVAEDRYKDVENPVIFPNVVALHIRSCRVYSRELANSFPIMRTLNLDNSIRPSLTSQNPKQIYKVSFPNLVSIEGCYEHIFDFLKYNACDNLRCLVITYLQGSHYDANPFPLSEAMRAVPGLKSLHVHQASKSMRSWWRTLGQPSLPSLTYLKLAFSLDATNNSEVISIQIPRILVSVPLVYISLSLEGNEYNIGLNTSNDVQATTTEYTIALSYARNIPSLKYIDVGKVIDSIPGPTMWWSIGRKEDSRFNDDNNVGLNALDKDEGMRLRDWYDQAAFRGED